MIYKIESRDKTLILGRKTILMGIINCTPDSFSDGGKLLDPETAVQAALQMVTDGADIIDIGGESSRPGSDSVSAEEEINRVVPVIEKLRSESDVWISIDTIKSAVAREALNAGAHIINDISGLRSDPLMAKVAIEFDVPVIVMHMKGNPQNMQENPVYDDVIAEISEYFKERIESLTGEGISIDKIIIDPGIGFGKTVDHNLRILNKLKEFEHLGRPVMIGVSRKSYIGKVLDLPVDERLIGTAASVAISIDRGAHIVRIHDVREIKMAAGITDAIIGKNQS